MIYPKVATITAVALILSLVARLQAQDLYSSSDFDKDYDMLLKNPGIQIEATEAVNRLYNFKFYEAESEFRWLQTKYPKHPLPHMLMALAEWWKIVPNPDNEAYDKKFQMHLDSTIYYADKMYDAQEKKVEPAFFMAIAYAYRARLHSERKSWTKATFAGKNALKYLDQCKGYGDLSPELLCGDGLYNYYAEWIPKEYPLLKPIFMFFSKGNKALGLRQLENVANNAFYTRTEARYFLLQIYSMENQYGKAYDMAKYMWQTYPDNPYFERYFCRTAFATGHMVEAEQSAKNILDKINRAMPGYEGVSGRNAAYVLGYYNLHYYKNYPSAKENYKLAIKFAEDTKSEKAGYYLSSLIGLGRIAEMEKDLESAQRYYKAALDNADRKSSQYKDAKSAIDKMKEARRNERRSRNK